MLCSEGLRLNQWIVRVLSCRGMLAGEARHQPSHPMQRWVGSQVVRKAKVQLHVSHLQQRAGSEEDLPAACHKRDRVRARRGR